MSKEERPKPFVSRLLVRADRTGSLGYEVEFEFPYGTTPAEFEQARKDGLTAIENWLRVPAPTTNGITEQTFNLLKWVPETGRKLTDYEVAYRDQNLPQSWDHCFAILKANSSTLKNHYQPEGFTFYYWLFTDKYTDRIFRKKAEAIQK